jgi:ELWxxDGT repeat protein
VVQKFVLLPLVAAICALPAMAQPYLVKDINPVSQNGSSSPDTFVRFGKYVFFTATTLFEGRELWASDGTAAGTFLLNDACPGECSGSGFPVAVTPRGLFYVTTDDQYGTFLWITRGTPASTILLSDDLSYIGSGSRAAWVESQGVLYFTATDKDHGSELWRSDGTPAGTVLVTDVWPGFGGWIGDLVVFGGRVFFSADDGVAGTALWVSDGTAAGTRMVKDTSPGASHNDGGLRRLRASSRYLFFFAPSPAGWELWRSDGTTKGTQMVADLVRGPESPFIYNAVAFGSRLYMETDVDGKGQELWVSEGTKAGTRKLTSFLNSQPFTSFFSPLRSLSSAVALGDQLVFPASDGLQGRELWVTNGTAAGTRLLKDVCPGSCLGVLSVWPAQGNRIFFTGTEGQRGVELWVSDGTAAGTRIVRDVCRQACSSSPSDPIAAGSRLFFLADDGRTGRQLWRTDGTSAGTVRVSELPAATFKNGLRAGAHTDRLFFAADDGHHGEELWLSDGTLAGTRLLADLDVADRAGSAPKAFMPLGDSLLFFADDGLHGSELWRSDGTADGTTLVHEFSPGPQAPAQFWPLWPNEETGGTVFFSAELGGSPRRMWKTDGTSAGTLQLTPEELDVRDGPRVAGGKVFFTAIDSPHGKELWVTDGTAAGTRLVTDLAPGTFASDPAFLTPFQGKLFFSAIADPPSFEGRRLWRSDGTEAGTIPLMDTAWSPRALTVHQGLLYFFAEDWQHGRELWRSDGTAAGTVLAADVKPGPGSLRFEAMTSLGSRLLLWNPDSSGTPELWVSDGTAAGSAPIAQVRLMFSLSGPLVLNGVVYFTGLNGSSGELLWRSDGTAAGTFPLRDRDGHVIPAPATMLVFGNRLYFIASDLGATLWQSDGTAEGTTPIRQLEPGQRSSLALAVAGSRLFFRAFEPVTGTELWAIDKP